MHRTDQTSSISRATSCSGPAERTLALKAYQEAVKSDPNNLEAIYSLYRQSTHLDGDEAADLRRDSLRQLVNLRPENLVLLLHQGRRSIETGDREIASSTFLRVAELAWQGPEIAVTASDKVLQALEGPDTSTARVPAARLENVLKITPMYQQGLRELNTGVQGLPVWRFLNEPQTTEFGSSLPLTWRLSSLDSSPSSGLASADFDGDSQPDLAYLSGDPRQLVIRTGRSQWAVGSEYPSPGTNSLQTVDLDNDGRWDLVASGSVTRKLAGDKETALSRLLPGYPKIINGSKTAALDYDIEGDLDLLTVTPEGLELWRNLLSEQTRTGWEPHLRDADTRRTGPCRWGL